MAIVLREWILGGFFQILQECTSAAEASRQVRLLKLDSTAVTILRDILNSRHFLNSPSLSSQDQDFCGSRLWTNSSLVSVESKPSHFGSSPKRIHALGLCSATRHR